MAGLLGEIFSAGNVAKRKLTDLLGNPLLSAQQFVGNLNDRARVLNEMTAAAAKEGVNYGPASKQLAGLLADAYNPMGITVYHGSPAKFSKFDPTKIGSGEGAQAYGYGHYVAESPGVAKEYQQNLSRDIVEPAKRALSKAGGNVDDAIKAANKEIERLNSLDLTQNTGAAKRDALVATQMSNIDELSKYKKSGDWTAGSLYEIDLPDEQIVKMLDWDKPLSQQPKAVKDALEARQWDKKGIVGYWMDKSSENPAYNGADLYHRLGSPDEAANFLKEAGIPGIRYLDQGSRGTGEGTSNFVVFPGNEDLLTILKRNGGLLGP